MTSPSIVAPSGAARQTPAPGRFQTKLIGYSCLLSALVWLLGIAVGCQPKPCYYCGSYYDIGARFKSFDRCNECRCVQDKVTGLGRVECSHENSCEGYCYWAGKKYSSRETLTVNGHCARCNCTPSYVKRFDKCGGVTFCLALRLCDP